MGQSAARKKTIIYSKHKIYIMIANVFQESIMFHQTIILFFYTKLYILITPWIHMTDTSCYFDIYQQFLCDHALPHFAITCTLKSKICLMFSFSPSVDTLTDLSGNIGFFSAGSKGDVCRL